VKAPADDEAVQRPSRTCSESKAEEEEEEEEEEDLVKARAHDEGVQLRPGLGSRV